MGGTGVVLSRVALRAVAGRLGGCLHSTASDHEDSELGRCVYNATGIACLQAQQARALFLSIYRLTCGFTEVVPTVTEVVPTVGGREGASI